MAGSSPSSSTSDPAAFGWWAFWKAAVKGSLLESLTPMWETLAQPWPLCAFGEWNSRYKISVYVPDFQMNENNLSKHKTEKEQTEISQVILQPEMLKRLVQTQKPINNKHIWDTLCPRHTRHQVTTVDCNSLGWVLESPRRLDSVPQERPETQRSLRQSPCPPHSRCVVCSYKWGVVGRTRAARKKVEEKHP